MPKLNREGQAHVLSKYEEGKIREKLPYPYRLIFEIGIYTGERWGAIRQLSVTDCYQSPKNPRDSITFRSITRKHSAGQKPKTRQIFVHPVLRLALIDFDCPPSGLLFPSVCDPIKPVSSQQCDYHLRTAIASLGMTGLGVSTHSTRRTFITRLANAGVSLHELKAITGHQSMDSLMRYIDGNPDTQKAAIMSL
jgi:integrase/recombinase XerD